MRIDGVSFPLTNVKQFAEEALLGRVGSSPSTTEAGPLDWLYRVWPKLPPAEAEKLGETIGEVVLNTKNREVQYNGLMFLTQHPQVRAWPRLQYLFCSPYRLHDAPTSAGEYSMRYWLIRAIASLAVETMWNSAVALLEEEALNPAGEVLPALHTLINCDAAWWIQHRADVLRLHPEAHEVVLTIEQA